MKTRKLRLLSALLALAMLFALMPTAAFADDGNNKCGENLTWELSEDGTLTISGSGKMADYDDPNSQPWAGQRDNIKHLVVTDGVTSIGINAFRYCINLGSVDLSGASSLSTIGDNAFHYCINLGSVDLSGASSLTTIGNYAFSSCTALESVDLSKASSLTTIKTSFSYCTKLNNVVLNEGLEEIGGSAFNHCESLKSIHIPSTVTAIGGWCFERCTSLSEVTFADNSQLTTIAGATFIYCRSLKKIMIPKSVKEILKSGTNGAFEDCLDLESVIFEPGSGLTTVENFAFYNCNKATIYCEDSKIDILKGKGGNIKSLNALNPVVTFEVDGKEFEKQNVKEKNFKAVKPENPTKKGYVFTGWYTKNADNEYKPFDFNTTVTEDITLYAQWEEVPVDTYVVTVENGVAWVEADAETEAVAAGKSICVPEGVTVHVKADETAFDGMEFERWEVRKGEVKLENDRAAETTFTMPAGEVHLEAMPRLESPDDSGWDAATVVTGAVIGTGTAILAYHIGMEVYAEQVLGKDVAVPRTRGEVALLAWQLAGSPEPNAAVALLTDEAKAQQWAVESGLLQPDAEGNFHAEKKLSKWKALRVLDAAKKQV